MNKDYFFDTDCLSSFLMVGEEDVMLALYKGRIIVPRVVEEELSKVASIHSKFRALKLGREIEVCDIFPNTKDFSFYLNCITKPVDGMRVIGRGEAAALTLAKKNNGIVASNNLKDIVAYAKKYNITYITTADILREALECNVITEKDGNRIWKKMLKAGRKIGQYATFSEYLEEFKKGRESR